MQLNPNLLQTDELLESDFESGLNGNRARGTYSPMQSVIRLRDDVHKALHEDGSRAEKMQAFSTFMHENIHWWQHVGSHLGFITSISYPALAHIAHRDLMALVQRNEKYKSIIEYDHYIYTQTGAYGNREVNSILNYYHDISYAKLFLANNENINIIIKDRRFFLHTGHCFHMLWSTSIRMLALSIDKEFNFLPKIINWHKNFKKLENDNVIGFTIDSGIGISPLGTTAIYEGQARFNQLQYLSIGSGDQFSYNDFVEMGMLQGIYIKAFDLFLELTEIDRPDNLNNPIIGLFLLICDIAINPVEGFPCDIMYYESFIISNDAGTRFTMLCHAIQQDKNRWVNAVQEYSRDEYIDLSEKLCDLIVCLPPLFGSALVTEWTKNNIEVKNLLDEESEMKFNPENLSIRLFTSKYIRFQEDKIKYPNIFCWTGKSMTGELSKELNLELVEEIFNRHQALFIDVIGGEIRPTIYDGRNKENTMNTFQSFYTYNTTYDMTMKWITEKGQFNYDYRWLTTQYSNDEMTSWVRENFKDAYSIYPEELKTF